ncbi:MAG: hypothetical protein A2901_08920 [Elusimicrobia bacterium RIFCSPLOWO2_01_FULL_54_10]|nr:MAG: hypothetical protein A2901_08920 [Elusimicrobia bacterium RIFCSPLOWO2_01_FULL_54_10]
METRTVDRVWQSKPTIEGAGVHLKRIFGFHDVPRLDPFLLMDDFRSDKYEDFVSGFPWHPHRGMETITYVLEGDVEHEDSLGNGGVISSGDVQWMTAGNGILHQEMPKGDGKGRMYGFQLWANLPAKDKMMDPRYRDVKNAQIPTVKVDGGVVRVISGTVGGVKGPVQDVVIDPEYLDISLTAGSQFVHAVKPGHNVFAYVIEGKENGSLIHFGRTGDSVEFKTEAKPMRFLLISGKPLNEPVAWYGPIVMNTEAELKTAFEEYNSGKFIKNSAGA